MKCLPKSTRLMHQICTFFKEQHLKDVIVVSIGFLLLFTAYGGLQNLQSSLNVEEGLGVLSLSIIYGTLLLSSMFLPPIIIKTIGCKWAIVAAMCCYITYTVGNFYPSRYTLIPTAFILGLGGGPLWTSKSTYLTVIGNKYAEKAGKLGKDIVNQYFGIFFLIFQLSGVFGNLISSLIFGHNSTKVEILNSSAYAHCGAGDCPGAFTSNNSTESHHPAKILVYTLLAVYTGCGILAVALTAIFLGGQTTEDKNQSFCTTFLATFYHLRDKRQCLLIPLTMFVGLEVAFISSEYTKSYITCVLGIQFVGYVMICFGMSTSLCSLFFGKISQYTGRIALLTLALYGVLFSEHKEAAFANYRLWNSLGFLIAFAYSNFLCVYVKLYVVLSMLIAGIGLYGIVECLECTKKPSTAFEAENKENTNLPEDEQTKL
ncbi:protein unc-93 homolog A isoform X2 [Microcaecilia unicolor]|uniref:Protein unc-93 homolog A n=1 Tax=Microcaecilia unicolor TaxID=1415580 RepID=A0A6P7XN38_9AMPH|nr:protein unc-93 homolog A-like isoform X2 [Microcaecilia unicolor]